jgi:hypothetical protein
MSEAERELRLRLKEDFTFYAEKCLKIRSESGSIIPLQLKRAQKYIYDVVQSQLKTTGIVRLIVLKGRQMGSTTLIKGIGYHFTTHTPGVRAFILTHEEQATNNLFDMVKRYHENCPEPLRPSIRASNAKELIFGGLDSGYKLGTAGNKSVGRSSTIQFLHASECAFWQHADEHASGIMRAVPRLPNTYVFLESTANGVGNWFHQQWQKAESGESDFKAVFVPWFWDDKYRIKAPDNFVLDDEEIALKSAYLLDDDQLYWRRRIIVELSVNGIDGAKKFRQEFPCNAAEAFVLSGEDAYIPPDIVVKARSNSRYNTIERHGPLLLGVDPARFGDDRTAIIRRQGRVAYGLETYTKKDTMSVAGIVNSIILKENPTKVFVDVGGLGAGVVDRLRELGHKNIVAVNSGENALDERKYVNKRAEMWALGKEWLLNSPCQLPDSDELHSDLCGTKYDWDSNSRLKIESKKDMKKRGVRSSDCADAFLLTFGLPVAALSERKDERLAEAAKKITAASKKVAKIKKTTARVF